MTREILRRAFTVPYRPQPGDTTYLERAEHFEDRGLSITLAVLTADESEQWFGVPMGRHGVQPIWLDIENGSEEPYRLDFVSIDPNYFSPLEAAYVCHFATARRLLSFAIFAWLYLPALLFLPFKLLSAISANRRMDEYFREHGMRSSPLRASERRRGFVFVPLQEGVRQVTVRLLGKSASVEFTRSVMVPGLKVDHGSRDFERRFGPDQLIDCDLAELSERLRRQPATTTNRKGTKNGDPLNLVVIADFRTILECFGARWDETEVVDFRTSLKMARAFVLGSTYRYAPVSPLYIDSRHQDFALQRARAKINERLHLRLWLTPLVYESQPVWIGQVSRDIGVRFTVKTWNLTTHKIDPDLDEAREYVVSDLVGAKHAAAIGYVTGVGRTTRETPGHNLTGDPYYSDGYRAAIQLSGGVQQARLLNWGDADTVTEDADQ